MTIFYTGLDASPLHPVESRLLINLVEAAVETNCQKKYGFIPCPITTLENFILVLTYGYIMFCPIEYLSRGSGLLLVKILGPGVDEGLLLPDAMLILD